MTIYKVGQVWERDGLWREIVQVNMGGNRFTDSTENLKTYYIHWRRPAAEVELQICTSTAKPKPVLASGVVLLAVGSGNQ